MFPITLLRRLRRTQAVTAIAAPLSKLIHTIKESLDFSRDRTKRSSRRNLFDDTPSQFGKLQGGGRCGEPGIRRAQNLVISEKFYGQRRALFTAYRDNTVSRQRT